MCRCPDHDSSTSPSRPRRVRPTGCARSAVALPTDDDDDYRRRLSTGQDDDDYRRRLSTTTTTDGGGVFSSRRVASAGGGVRGATIGDWLAID